MTSTREDSHTVFICGAGHQGLSMAAHLALNGVKVHLWNRTEENIKDILNDGLIQCSGIVNGDAKIDMVSANMSEVVTDFVMVTTPSNAHKDIAGRLAPFVHRNMVIVLNPGRTFGAIEFAEELKKQGIDDLPHIAETQTIVYTCRKNGPSSTSIFALKNKVEIAAIEGSDINYIMSKMPRCLVPYFKVVPSVGVTSFSNVGMVLHCAPVMMNVGWIESEKVDFKYYYDGISPSISSLLEKIDEERLAVAKAGGYIVDSVKEWMKKTYSINGDSLYECIRNNVAYKEIDAPPTINTRYIFEDVPNGLVPIEFIGKELGVPTPNITTVISMACAVMNTDYREIGRCFGCEHLRNYL